jgi:hypothetical protein
MSCSRSSRSGSRLRRDGVQLVGRISRAPSYRGPSHGKPRNDKRHGGWRSVCVSSSTIWDDGILLPDPTGCQAGRRRFTQIPVIGSIPIAHHRNAGTYDRLCSPLQSCSSSGSRYHRNLHQDEFGSTRAERMQARCGGTLHHRIIGISKFPANPCKFPALC